MDKSKVTVIVTQCSGSHEKGDLTAWGERDETSHFNCIAAMEFAETERAKGICVIVRPNYNEKNAQGEFFREWRSFHGEAFKEVRFDIP